jgi:hypothetical protein
VSWAAVIALCGAAYALKALGTVVAARVPDGTAATAGLDVLVVPVIAGLIVVQTLGTGHHLVLDARLPAVLLAALLVWRRAPLLVVVIAAAGTAAALRALGL